MDDKMEERMDGQMEDRIDGWMNMDGRKDG